MDDSDEPQWSASPLVRAGGSVINLPGGTLVTVGARPSGASHFAVPPGFPGGAGGVRGDVVPPFAPVPEKWYSRVNLDGFKLPEGAEIEENEKKVTISWEETVEKTDKFGHTVSGPGTVTASTEDPVVISRVKAAKDRLAVNRAAHLGGAIKISTDGDGNLTNCWSTTKL